MGIHLRPSLAEESSVNFISSLKSIMLLLIVLLCLAGVSSSAEINDGEWPPHGDEMPMKPMGGELPMTPMAKLKELEMEANKFERTLKQLAAKIASESIRLDMIEQNPGMMVIAKGVMERVNGLEKAANKDAMM